LIATFVMSQSLGKGLQSLIPKKGSDGNTSSGMPARALAGFEDGKVILEIAPSRIRENPHQPRKRFEESSLNDLVESIRAHGILQPLVVTPFKEGSSRLDRSSGEAGEYELIAGERRLRAAKMLHLKSVPVIIRTVGELQKLELALIENIQRKDLNPIERALAYRKLVDEFSLTHEEAAKRLGTSRASITNTLRLLQLPGMIQKAIGDGRLSEGQAKVILELPSEEKQIQLFERVQKEGMTVRDIERVVRSKRVGLGARRRVGKGRYYDYEQQLSRALGTNVTIRKKGKGGTVEIDWFAEDDLNRIIELLTAQLTQEGDNTADNTD